MFLCPLFSRGQSSAGPDPGVGLQECSLGTKIPKLHDEEPCKIQWSLARMGSHVARYGPKVLKTVLGLGRTFPMWHPRPQGRSLCPQGDLLAPWETFLDQGQPLRPWGGPFVLGASLVLKGQLRSPRGNPFPPEATPLPLGTPFAPGPIPWT